MNNPIIVVGRPRSGSTLFTHLLNESPDLCMINDFYYLQYVDSLGGFTRQDSTLLKCLAKQILFILKDRQRPDDGNRTAGIESNHFLNLKQTQCLEKFIKQCSSQPHHNWSSLFASIMQYNARLFGKPIWGYNTPQDYLHLPRLQRAFPQAKFIFMMRDPRAVLRSYKYMDYLKNFHDPSRYHPVFQAIAWKSAMESFFQNQPQNNVFLVRYEDLIKDTNQVLLKVSDFLDIEFPQINLENFGNNSTFRYKKKQKLSNTETWLCEQIAGREMQAVGYQLKRCKPSLQDFNEMFCITGKSLQFYLKNSLISPDTRKRVFNLIKTRLITRK